MKDKLHIQLQSSSPLAAEDMTEWTGGWQLRGKRKELALPLSVYFLELPSASTQKPSGPSKLGPIKGNRYSGGKYQPLHRQLLTEGHQGSLGIVYRMGAAVCLLLWSI